jgi:hypothetical protein
LCEIWSLTLKEEHRLRILENRMLRRILGHQREEAAGRWTTFHNEELLNFHSSPKIIRMMK